CGTGAEAALPPCRPLVENDRHGRGRPAVPGGTVDGRGRPQSEEFSGRVIEGDGLRTADPQLPAEAVPETKLLLPGAEGAPQLLHARQLAVDVAEDVGAAGRTAVQQ